MYNNFSSKKTKKVISALLASALVVTSAPISAEAATTKVLGVNKTFTKTATKVSGLSKSEKKIVKVTVNKRKKKVTVKGLKPGKATFKIGSKSYTVKVGAVAIKKKSFATSMTAGTDKKVTVTSSYGAKDTLKWSSSDKKVVKVKLASTTATSKKVATNRLYALAAGSATITVKSKNTGKSLKVKVTVKAATPATTPTTVPTATGSATTTPSVAPTATATGSATTTPSVAPTATVSGGATTTPSVAPTATGGAIATPEATTAAAATATPSAIPTVEPTKTPEVTTTPAVTLELKDFSAVNSMEDKADLSDLPASATLVFEFNQAIVEESANVNNIRIYEEATNVPLSFAASNISISADKTTVKVALPYSTIEKGTAYKVVVKDVTTKSGSKLAETTKNFTVSKMAIATSTSYTYADMDDIDVNSNPKEKAGTTFINNIYPENESPSVGAAAGDPVKSVSLTYDAALDRSTITTANVSLTDVKTGKKMPIEISSSVSGNTTSIKVVPTAGFEDGKQYILSVGNGVLTSVGNKAEAYTTAFAIRAVAPLSSVNYNTIDNKGLGDTYEVDMVWPKLTSGMKETSTTDAYYAGLNIVIKTNGAEKWDPTTINDNIQLIEKQSGAIVETTMTYNADAQMLNIVPKADLKENTIYAIQYKGGLKTSLGIYLDATKKDKVVDGKTKTFTTLDVTAPSITEITSNDGLTDLKKDEDHSFVVTLSEDLDLVTKRSSLVVCKTSVKNDDNTTFGGIVSQSDYTVTKVIGSENKYLVKILKDKLEKNEAYKIMVVGKDIKDTALVTNGRATVLSDDMRNKLEKTYTLAFTTEGEDVTGPVVKNVYKGDAIKASNLVATSGAINVVDTDYFTVEFNEKINASVASSKIKLYQNISGTWTEITTSAIDNVDVVDKENATGFNYGVKFRINNNGNNLVDAKYKVVFEKGAVKDLAGNDLADDYSFTFTGSDEEDTAATVAIGKITGTDSLTFNAGDSTAAAVDSIVTIKFAESEIVEIPTGAIKVTDAKGNVVDGKLEEITDTVTGFTGAKRYVFKPSAKLAYGTTYTVTVEGVYDFIGNEITKMQYQFKTADEALKVSSVSVADKATNVDLQKTITINLNQAVDYANDTGSNFTSGKKNVKVELTGTNSGNADIDLSTDKKSVTLKFTGDSKLAANTTYTLTITPQTGDGAAWNDVADAKKTITFTTGMTATDDIKPTLDTATIDGTELTADVKTNVAIGAGTLVFTFSEKVKKDNAKVVITDQTDNKSTVSIVNTSLDATGKVLTVSTLNMNTDDLYKVEVSGIVDEAGNVADTKTYYVQHDADAADADAALTTAAGNVETYYASHTGTLDVTTGILVDMKTDASGSDNTKLKTAINDTKVTVDSITKSGENYVVTLISSGYTAASRTTTVNVPVAKITLTNAALITVKDAIDDSAYTDSTNELSITKTGEEGATLLAADFESALTSEIAGTGVTVTNYSHNDETDVYTITLSKTVGSDVITLDYEFTAGAVIVSA